MVSQIHFDSYHCVIQDILVIPCMVHLSDSTDHVLIGKSQVNSRSFLGVVYFPGVAEIIGIQESVYIDEDSIFM